MPSASTTRLTHWSAGQLGDPKLGMHNGLPVTVIVSTTLQELTAAAGHLVTAAETLLPMRDLIRMAATPTINRRCSTSTKVAR